MKGICKPLFESDFEKKAYKKCPFCSEDLDKIAIIKRKAEKTCKCKHCGKLILGVHIVW